MADRLPFGAMSDPADITFDQLDLDEQQLVYAMTQACEALDAATRLCAAGRSAADPLAITPEQSRLARRALVRALRACDACATAVALRAGSDRGTEQRQAAGRASAAFEHELMPLVEVARAARDATAGALRDRSADTTRAALEALLRLYASAAVTAAVHEVV